MDHGRPATSSRTIEAEASEKDNKQTDSTEHHPASEVEIPEKANKNQEYRCKAKQEGEIPIAQIGFFGRAKR